LHSLLEIRLAHLRGT